uniref:MADF domain-containing protein n=2 Tax=Anopheles atroparvus TaxID=41427 RepID=A0A182IXZ8_ANOAO
MANKQLDEEKLIMLVQENRQLWDRRDINYKDFGVKKNTWRSIGEQLNVDDIIAKNRWRYLRDTYCRKIIEINQPSGSGCKPIQWKHFDQMGFLKDTLASRPRMGNVEGKEENSNEGQYWMQDGPVLDDVLTLEKERHEVTKKRFEHSGNYHAMLSFVPLLDRLTEEDQMDAREQIIKFAHQIIREKKKNYRVA